MSDHQVGWTLQIGKGGDLALYEFIEMGAALLVMPRDFQHYLRPASVDLINVDLYGSRIIVDISSAL